MRRLALAELRLFILGEQVATLRSLLATLQQGEPAIAEALAEARIRLAGRGQESRAFIDASGALVDRAAPVNLTQADGPVTVTVSVTEARLRWRLEVVEVLGDRETLLAEVMTDDDMASLSFVPPSAAAGPTGLIEVRVLSMERQNLDGDPATVPSIDTEAAAWVGLEPTPDVYRFVFALPADRPACTPPPGYLRGPVASTFDSGDEGWTTSGDADRVPISSGGAISAADHETGGTWYWNAPPSFLGDRQRLFGGTLVYALRTDGSGRPFPAADVVLEGNGLTLTLEGDAPGANWTTYEIALDPASPWMNGGNPATAAEIRQALACVTALRIRGEYTNGPDRGWFDDFAFGVGPTSTPNLLVNGSFEEGPLPGSFLTLGSGSAAIEGWTVVADTVDYVGTSMPAADGGRHIDLDGTPGAGAIEQSFSTIAGEMYEVTFDLASNTGWPPPIKRLQVEAAGDSGFFSHLDGQSWSPITWRFRALGPETTIRFRSLTDIPDPYGGALIDNVSVHFAPE